MAFSLSELTYIISTIEDLLFMSDRKSLISVATGSDDDEYNKVFTQLTFNLKRGRSEIRIYSALGTISYLDADGEILKKLDFVEDTISTTYSSFNKALKQMLDFDRQRMGKTKSINIPDSAEDISDEHPGSVNSSLDEIRKIIPEAN
jgi:hypothetical protein